MEFVYLCFRGTVGEQGEVCVCVCVCVCWKEACSAVNRTSLGAGHWALVQRVMARSAVCTSPPHQWGAPRLGDGTTSLCHLHHLVGPYHPLAWFFLPLLCR